MRSPFLLGAAGLCALLAPCPTRADVLVSQLPWPTTSHKTVLLTGSNQVASGSAWTLTRSGGGEVGRGLVEAGQGWAPMANEVGQVVVLPDTLAPGAYHLVVGSNQLDVQVQDQAWMPLAKGLVKGFYYQRAGIELTSSYAGAWARPISFESGYALYHPSTGKSTGGKNSPKGWFDAGDYNKYIVNSGISTWCLLSLYEQFPSLFDTMKLGIPEDGGAIPPLLAEARWNLEWMLTMQDDDGGVFHKWTQKAFGDFVLPHLDKADRYLVGKSSPASYDFAAVMALASRVFAKHDPSFAATTLAAAKRANTWALANHTKTFSQPTDVNTGEYGDGTATDERYWAGVELSITTGDPSLFVSSGMVWGLPWWKEVGMLGAYEVVSHPSLFSASAVQKAHDAIFELADSYRDRVVSGPWASPQQDPSTEFDWGSNSQLAHMGLHSLFAYWQTGDRRYLDVGDVALDHLMGRNPLKTSNVTGFGTRKPMKIHHRISGGDNVVDPVPGLVVGGPFGGGDDVMNDPKSTWMCKEYRVGGKTALDWFDDQCSYATNEIAINWNASASYLAMALSALHGPAPRGPAWSKAGLVDHRALERSLANGVLVPDRNGWVEVLDADGKRLVRAPMRAGQPWRVPVGQGIRFVVLHPDGIGARPTVLRTLGLASR